MASHDRELWTSIALNGMPDDKDRLSESKQRSASPRSTRYRHDGSGERPIITDDRAPAVERVEVLSQLSS